jgi:iduronate 2-sulfatase
MPLLADPQASWTPAYVQARSSGAIGRSVVTEQWRYTEWDDGNQGLELYDIERDPGEHANLASDPDLAATLSDLHTLLLEHRLALDRQGPRLSLR